jgi:hypothetical protein
LNYFVQKIRAASRCSANCRIRRRQQQFTRVTLRIVGSIEARNPTVITYYNPQALRITAAPESAAIGLLGSAAAMTLVRRRRE